MRLPYGKSDFAELRRGGYVFADKTGFIPALESAEKGRHYLVFLRPRRMGKTLLVSMLEHYYDILAAPSWGAMRRSSRSGGPLPPAGALAAPGGAGGRWADPGVSSFCLAKGK